MNKINKNNYTVKQSAPTSYWITFNEKKEKGKELSKMISSASVEYFQSLNSFVKYLLETESELGSKH